MRIGLIEIALIVLGILYLNDFSVGTALAICAIVEGGLLVFLGILKGIKREY